MSQNNNSPILLFNQKFFIPEILQNSQALLTNKKNIERYSWEVEGERVNLKNKNLDSFKNCN